MFLLPLTSFFGRTWHCCCCFLARSANLPTGLCIMLVLISSFFLLGAKLSQYLLDRFSRSFYQIKGICVNFLDPVHFFRFLKGRCHGNQFCVVSKTQTTCDFCNFYTKWKRFGCRWCIWFFFQYLKGCCHDNQFCLVPDSFARSRSISGSAGPIFTIFAPYGRYWMADVQSDLLFPIS